MTRVGATPCGVTTSADSPLRPRWTSALRRHYELGQPATAALD